MIALFLAPVYILVNIYVVQWILRWMGACSYLFQTFVFRMVFTGIYIFFASSLLTGFLLKKPSFVHRFLKITGNYFLGTFLYILITIGITDCGRLLFTYIFPAPWIGSKSAFILIGTLCFLTIVCTSLYGIFHVGNIKTIPYEINVKKQVSKISSLKIVLIADTHFGYNYGYRQAIRLVEKINAENPDLVCIAGDIFDNEYDALCFPDKIKNSLKAIHSTYGVYSCWGNHDLNEPILAGFTFKNAKEDYNDPRMKSFLQESEIHLLNDESVLIDDAFYLIGRKDMSLSKKLNDKRLTPVQLTKDMDQRKPIIFIDHQPKELSEIAAAGADLDLCGHTHNGQIFPGNFMIHLFWDNACGYHKENNLHNIVTSGVGVWGPKMRVGTDSEICSITVNFQ